MSRRKFAPAPSDLPPPPRALRVAERRGLPWGKLFLLFLLGIAALAWFAPSIIVKSSWRDKVVASAMQGFPGRIAIGSASAGWLSPIELTDTSAFDAQGQEILTISSIRTGKNLFSLLLDHREIGTVRVEQPKLKLELRPDGSNVEDLVNPWLAAQKSSTPVGFGIEIVDGSVEGANADGSSKWRLDRINTEIKIPVDRKSTTVRAKTEIATEGSPAGSLIADIQWNQAAPTTAAASANETASNLGEGTATIQTEGLPLQIVAIGLRRIGLDVQLAGQLTTKAALKISERIQEAKIEQLTAQNLSIASPTLLGTDHIQLAAAAGSGELFRSTTEWQMRNVSLKSEVGEFNASGTGPLRATDSLNTQLAGAIRSGNWELRGNVDLAKLAAMMPNTLRLREGTHISSGQVTMDLSGQSNPQGNVWNAALEANHLAAIHAGNSFEWKKPITVKAAVHETATGITVEQLICDSNFLKLTGKGTLDEGQFVVAGDLSQFVDEVGRFVDLGQLRTGGKFNGQVEWQNNGGQSLSITGKGAAQDFELTYAADRPWQEKQLDVQFTADGKILGGRVSQIDKGTLNVTAAGDVLDAQLLEPVLQPSSATPWPCHVHLRGSLGRWLARMQMFFTLDPWQLAGENADIEGDARISTTRVEFANTNGSVKNFAFIGSGLNIREPVLQVVTSGAYDVARGEFTSPSTKIAGTTIALQAQNSRFQYSGGQTALDGDIQYRANVERLMTWIGAPQEAPTSRMQGEATGVVRLESKAGVSHVDATANIDNFAYSVPSQRTGLTVVPVGQPSAGWQELWKEPRLELALQGSLNAAGDQATIEKLEVAGDSLSIGARGEVRDPFARCEIDLSGRYAYDLERLASRLRGMIGPQLQMVGTGDRPFVFRGPLFAATTPAPTVRGVSTTSAPARSGPSLEEMLAEVSVGWQKLVVQGFEIGEGEIATKLQQGQLTISPIDLPVSEGKIVISPRIDVTKTPYVATVEPGTVVDHVRISPEMCRSWLKYLAPLVADATAANGHFSVGVSDAKFPIADPTGGNVQGNLIVHAAQIGPGPLSQEIIGTVQQIRAILDRQPLGAVQTTTDQWLNIPEQQLAFQLADHRVYHKDMQFIVKDVAVRTSGWVGLDQQLALVADIPVRDEWVSKDRYLASLKGKSIRLPINGSLTRPQLDRTALRQLTSQTVIDAGSNLLQDQLNRGLERGLNKLLPQRPMSPTPQQPPPM